MLLGLVGDIHGNAHALEAVLQSARELGVSGLLVTGDLVGYYYAPSRALGLLSGWKTWTVRGNHEDMLRDSLEDPSRLAHYESLYGSGLRVALDTLPREQLQALAALPHPLELSLDGCRILLCHGAPWDNDVYIYPDASPASLERCAAGGYDLVVLGHTHYPMVHRVGATMVVNPGSVGQPRDRQPGAAWGVFDTATRAITLRREPYPVAEVAAEAARRHPEIPYLAEVLLRR